MSDTDEEVPQEIKEWFDNDDSSKFQRCHVFGGDCEEQVLPWVSDPFGCIEKDTTMLVCCPVHGEIYSTDNWSFPDMIWSIESFDIPPDGIGASFSSFAIKRMPYADLIQRIQEKVDGCIPLWFQFETRGFMSGNQTKKLIVNTYTKFLRLS